MPPKPKIKEIVEDFSDAPNLPDLNYFIFNYSLDFKNKERKDALLAKIKEQFVAHKIITIINEEVIDYGKGKLIIVEEHDEKNPEKRVKALSMKLFQ